MTTSPNPKILQTPKDPEQLRVDVASVLEILQDGGVAIIPMDVAYAIIGSKEAAIRKIFKVKQRSYEKPSGFFSNWQLSQEIHIMDEDRHQIVKTMIEEVKLPFSVVAPFKTDHPFFKKVDPFVLQNSTKVGTLDMLFNAGQFHDEIVRQSIERDLPVFGSSANQSLQGSNYQYADIEEPIREAADIYFDYGQSKYANEMGYSSTIIDFINFSVIRVGIGFDILKKELKERFDVDLKEDQVNY